MKPKRPSFETVSKRRFRLAGKAIIEQGHPYFVPVDKLEADTAHHPDGFVNFAHYDYLGLAKSPQIIAAGTEALARLGSGVGASRLVGGERTSHRALEKDLASFFGLGSTLTLISGYLANVTLISHLLGPRDLVIFDELAHNSIMLGAKAGRYDHMSFEHNNLEDLEAKLTECRHKYRHVLVIVEGLYSMDGDVPDLPELLRIKDQHDAWLLVDEAHSYGVLGATGRGLCEYFDVDPSAIDLSIGTLSKTFVSSGGFVGASANVIEWLRFTLPGFVYSVGLSPASTASAHAALSFLKDNPQRVQQLDQNSALFLNRARAAGLNTGDAIGSGVVPILFESPEQTMMVSQILLQAGIYAPPIVQVGVPKDQPRIRFFLSASHKAADIERVVDVMAEALSDQSYAHMDQTSALSSQAR